MTAGNARARAGILTWVGTALWYGPTPVAVALRRSEEIRKQVAGYKEAEAFLDRQRGAEQPHVAHAAAPSIPSDLIGVDREDFVEGEKDRLGRSYSASRLKTPA